MAEKKRTVTFSSRDFERLEAQLCQRPRSEEPIPNHSNEKNLKSSGQWRVEDFVHLCIYIRIRGHPISCIARFFREMPRQGDWITVKRAILRKEINCVKDRNGNKRLERDSCLEYLRKNFPDVKNIVPGLMRIKSGVFENIKKRDDVRLQKLFVKLANDIHQKNQLYRRRNEKPLRKSSYVRIIDALHAELAQKSRGTKKLWLDAISKLEFSSDPGNPTKDELLRESKIITALSRRKL